MVAKVQEHETHDGSHPDCDVCQTLREVRRIFQEIGPEFLPREARWRYYGPRGALGKRHPATVYFYTTEKVQGRFQSGVYRYLKTKKLWKPTLLHRHALKRNAMARAEKLWTVSQAERSA